MFPLIIGIVHRFSVFQREIDNDLMPKLKNHPMDSITRLKLTALLKDVEKRAPEVARYLRNHLWGMFEYAIDSGLMENNPVPPLRVMKRRKQTNHPAPTWRLSAEAVRLRSKTAGRKAAARSSW
ncbi:phage integrase central domain-containing protein [Hydrogenophaga laconesensis]|uniref:Phage integrase central domain-containing protein n=1 Tax=Hydrogenophaga laconesensis TaxID=1805971 RepID=A0ABU1VGG0_9BURK|nr:hypothetical protein [Hydrogenophaga laconesensis]MDR7096532.1 hypothetical protein [Hydrogenophaga laconesensis]